MVPTLRRAARPSGALRMSVRNLMFMNKNYAPSEGYQEYSKELETDIAQTLKDLPAPNKVYYNADGSVRDLEESQMKQAAALGALAGRDRLTFKDRLFIPREEMDLVVENDALLEDFFLNGRRIVDKVPVEDPKTGEVTWQVIREGEREGWQPLMYYLYVPGLLVALGLYLFGDRENLSEWALEELRLRAQERAGDTSTAEGLSPEEKKKRDDLIVERIISGDYDRLAGLRKAGSDMPSSLL